MSWERKRIAMREAENRDRGNYGQSGLDADDASCCLWSLIGGIDCCWWPVLIIGLALVMSCIRT